MEVSHNVCKNRVLDLFLKFLLPAGTQHQRSSTLLLFTCSHWQAPQIFRQIIWQVSDSNLSVAGRTPSILLHWRRPSASRSFSCLVLKPRSSKLDHRQACCTWLISSPKRSKSPSTHATFCRHFCTVSSWPRSPICNRREAIWITEPQTDTSHKR